MDKPMDKRWIIGIDLGVTSKHAVHVFDTHTGEPALKRFTFAHTAAGMQQFLDRLERIRKPDPEAGFLAVMEPTGKMWIAVAAVLREHGIESRLAPTHLAAAYRKKRKRGRKTNAIDAETLARLPLVEKKLLPPACLREQPAGDLHSWCKLHERLTQAGAGVKNALYAQFHLVSPQMLRCFGDDPFIQAGRLFMRRYVDPRRALRSGPKRLTTAFSKVARVDDERAEELAQHVHACAQSVVEFYRLVLDAQALPFSFDAIQAQVNVLLDQLESYEKQLRTVEKHIAALYAQLDPEASSKSLPGFGDHIAPVVDSCVGSIGRFKNADAFAAYVRTVPRHNRTGAGRARPGEHESQPLRKDGNRYMQKQFYLAADVARRYDVDCAQCYLKFKAERLHHNQCVIAVGHKLALRYYALKRRQLTDPQARYEFRDERGRPISKEQARAIVERLYAEADAKAQAKGEVAEPRSGSAGAELAQPSTLASGPERREAQAMALGELLPAAAAALGLDPAALAQAVADLRARSPESTAQESSPETTEKCLTNT